MMLAKNSFRFAACLIFAALVNPGIANAGSMYVILVVNPLTTAGAGVPASNGMAVSSSKSGLGTFQLYALDDVDNSFGIKSYQIKLNGTITTFLNRATNGAWNDTDGAGPYAEGFNDVRTAVAATGITSAGQNPTNPFFIKGFGITAGNLVTSNTAGAQGFDATSTTASTSGQWGNYSPTLGAETSGIVGATGHVRSAIFLAEGNYSGAYPAVDLVTAGGTAINYFNSQSGSGATSAPALAAIVVVTPEPATLTLVGLAVAGLGAFSVRRRG